MVAQAGGGCHGDEDGEKLSGAGERPCPPPLYLCILELNPPWRKPAPYFPRESAKRGRRILLTHRQRPPNKDGRGNLSADGGVGSLVGAESK